MDPISGKPLAKNELLKADKPDLSGNIRETLANPEADRFTGDDEQFIKFHGIYQQDDRDKRKTGKEYSVMVRTRQTGGIVPAGQYLVYDELSGRFANGTLRITSRQTFQFHGVLQKGIGPLIKSINDALSSTLATCGDVNRNVTAPSNPPIDAIAVQVDEDAFAITRALLPRTTAYHSIWVDGVQVDLGLGEKIAKARASVDQANPYMPPPADTDESGAPSDPLYGKTYLPRKFKVAFAATPVNDVDILTNCLGFIAIEENGKLIGYNLTVGGGLGRSHGNEETYPRIADVIGFLTPSQLIAVSKGVLTIHRDFGDRTNRKHARLKYVLEEKGAAWFRAELESRLGHKLADAKPFKFDRQGDHFGWDTAADGRKFLGLYVETGRIKDKEGYRLKHALKLIAERFKPEFRLTPSQNIVIANIAAADESAITQLLAEHGIPVENQTTALRRASMACPSMPTCGLGLAESERYLPELLGRFENVLSELGLKDNEIIIRMTGCPNGCARPYMAEIGFVGKAPGRYQVYLGGNEACTRLNRLWKDNVKDPEIITELRPLLEQYAKDRIGSERFGDWAARTLWTEQPAAS